MALLEVRGVTKHFGGVAALVDVDLSVVPSEIHGLIGPNGSGKTTLFNVISGFQPVSRGEVRLDGVRLTRHSPHEIVRLGVARTFQNIQLFGGLTVLEHVMVGCHCRTGSEILAAVLRTRRVRAEERAIRERAMELLESLDLAGRAGDDAKSLPYGAQRILEIGRALATGPRVLLLDEPAAGMNATETTWLTTAIGRIRERGVTLVVIEAYLGSTS